MTLVRWAVVAALVAPVGAQEPARKVDLAVLYAGAEDHPRTERWVAFLQSHFRRAEAIALPSLSAQAASDYDVVIVDAPSPYRPDGNFEMPQAPRLGLDFTNPAILLGAAGGSVLSGLRIKLDWL